MKQLSFFLLLLLLPASIAAQNIDKKLLLIEFPTINNHQKIKSINAKTYEAKMVENNYSQTKGELLDSEKITYNKEGYINLKESERKNLDQKITIKVQPNNTNFSTIQKQGKRWSQTTAELTNLTPTTALYTIQNIGVGVMYKTKEIQKNTVISTIQDENKNTISIDTTSYNDKGYPLYQFTDAVLDNKRIEYRHQYDQNGWITSTYIKTINILKNKEGENVEEITTFSQRYQYVHQDKFKNWLTRYTFNQNNKLINITQRIIDYY